MTHDDDRTQEFRRGEDQSSPSTPPGRWPGGTGTTPPFGTRAASGVPDDNARSRQQPPGDYRPAPAPIQGQPPMLPADRGSGGFPAALAGAVVAALVAIATAFGSYRLLRSHPGIDPTKLPGFVVDRMALLPWPAGGVSDVSAAFVAGVGIVLVLALLLMTAAAAGTRAGTGGFALFLGAWMASVIAGGVARPVAGVIARHGASVSAAWQVDLSAGVQWGVIFGWIAALALLVTHAARRKPAIR